MSRSSVRDASAKSRAPNVQVESTLSIDQRMANTPYVGSNRSFRVPTAHGPSPVPRNVMKMMMNDDATARMWGGARFCARP